MAFFATIWGQGFVQRFLSGFSGPPPPTTAIALAGSTTDFIALAGQTTDVLLQAGT